MMRYVMIIFGVFIHFFVFASKVEIVQNKNGFQLLKDGAPYYIQGAGGTENLDKLKEYGGNSIRTWGIDAQTDNILANAKKHNITVCFGIWIGQERQGFDYSNKDALESQLEMVRETVRKYKNHPSILIWGIGNEMDLDYTNFEVWKHMEEICKIVKEEDPNHPTMLVTAGLDVAEIKLIKKNTPSLDILGINTYGNISYIKEAINMYDWDKPYIVAEWGPYGWWEVEKTAWGAAIEETSTQKAKTYEASMKSIMSDSTKCLGSYVFLWGQKQETTSTWFSMFTEEGDETEVMDVIIKGWTGFPPENKAPSITQFLLQNQIARKGLVIQKDSFLRASVTIMDPDGDDIEFIWQIIPESTDKKSGGDKEKSPQPIKGIFKKSDYSKNNIIFKLSKSGPYRLFLFAKDGQGNVATGNIPFLIE
ncbi:MAG: glycoside hydrolase family 2 TIM barrel-domain containing protein [Flavobacteriales bacterium]|nr:glycoside hydrolase family 2 TIM barrel-domain containing protein [Flavobacteriales bacterium]